MIYDLIVQTLEAAASSVDESRRDIAQRISLPPSKRRTTVMDLGMLLIIHSMSLRRGFKRTLNLGQTPRETNGLQQVCMMPFVISDKFD